MRLGHSFRKLPSFLSRRTVPLLLFFALGACGVWEILGILNPHKSPQDTQGLVCDKHLCERKEDGIRRRKDEDHLSSDQLTMLVSGVEGVEKLRSCIRITL